jgi:hypothetical protein
LTDEFSEEDADILSRHRSLSQIAGKALSRLLVSNTCPSIASTKDSIQTTTRHNRNEARVHISATNCSNQRNNIDHDVVNAYQHFDQLKSLGLLVLES